MKTILKQIDDLAKVLNSLLPMKPENQKILDKKFRLEFNFNSNHLEGNTLTYSETELLLIFDDTKGSHTLREYEEMKAHDVAYNLVNEWAKDSEHPLNEKFIKDLNEIILVRPFWKDAITPDGQKTRRQIKVGEYKEFPNSVRLQNGEMFEYTSPTETPILMGELIQWYKNAVEKNEFHPVVLAALFHYKFVCIHPFDDGNGRVSRLLMNYVLIKNNLPPIVIKSAEKRHYLSALNRADTGNIEEFIKYIGEQLIWSLELSIKAAKGENIDEPEDFDKKLALLKQEFEAEDEENEIKTSLNSGVLKITFDDWWFNLFSELANTTIKFDGFYQNSNHNILISIDGSGNRIGFDNQIPKDRIDTHFSDIGQFRMLSNAIVSFRCAFMVYKKGGLNPFSCNYLVEIKFEQNDYEILIPKFNVETGNSSLVRFTKRLLHKPLLAEEIQEINKIWGETLLNHLEFNRKQTKSN